MIQTILIVEDEIKLANILSDYLIKEGYKTEIIDLKKNSGWIHKSQLVPSKSLIVTSEKILFKKPTKYSEPLAKLENGRLLIFNKCMKNWCSIKTGQFSGWIDKNNIWGIVK